MHNKPQQGIIITQTPFRLSFFGGGTDFPEYFNQENASVIGTAIDKYIYVTINSLDRFYEKRIRLSYSKLEYVDHHDELEHKIVKCILSHHPYGNNQEFLDINTYADLPAASGVGSSSAFVVGMLNALYWLNGKSKSTEKIAHEAIHLERNLLQDKGGWQDQIFASFGGFNRIYFNNNNFTVEPISIALPLKEALEKSCLLFFTGDTRSSADVQQSVMYVDGKLDYLKEIKQVADDALSVLNQATTPNELIQEFGMLLHKAWEAKKALSSHISNSKIDGIYDAGIKAGAIGGKLCGAGNGGFLLFIVPETKQEAVTNALAVCKKIPIQFEQNGCRLIYSKISQIIKDPVELEALIE